MLSDLVRAWSIGPRDQSKLARGVQSLVQTNVRYLREHPETYQHPVRTLALGTGDCDDMTILACALLRNAKIPCRAVFVFWDDPATGKRKGHVYSEAFVDARWTPIETVRPVPFGWSPLDAITRKGATPKWVAAGDPESGPVG